MSKPHLVVLWENFRDNQATFTLVENGQRARAIARRFKASRRRRADIIAFGGEELKRLCNLKRWVRDEG